MCCPPRQHACAKSCQACPDVSPPDEATIPCPAVRVQPQQELLQGRALRVTCPQDFPHAIGCCGGQMVRRCGGQRAPMAWVEDGARPWSAFLPGPYPGRGWKMLHGTAQSTILM